MKNTLYPLIVSLILLVSTHFSFSQNNEIKEQIIGSWELVQYIDHSNKGQDWQKYNSDIIYQKHITDSHFVWLKYDKSTDQLLGMGGGTYIINKAGKYVENIDFFYPPGSSELGQSIPFSIQMKKGNWIHTGYAKNMDYTEEGNVVVTDSTKIEELWKPLFHTNNNRDLIGTWDLVSYREKADGQMIEYPEFIVYMKLVTPSHFVWVKYDNEGDEIYAAGSGPYHYDGKNYTEKIRVSYPKGNSAQGKDVVFSAVVNANKWIHKGIIPVEGGEDLLIDEIWNPKKATFADLTAFQE